MRQLGLWETVDPAQLMRPMAVQVTLRGGLKGPGYAAWRKRLVFHLSLLGMTAREEGGRFVVRARTGGNASIRQRARMLDWLLAQDDVLGVECAWPRPDEASFSIQIVEAGF